MIEEYQNARVEGFIPAEWEFEDYLLAEVKQLRKELEEKENRLYVAEDVLGRSGFWYDVYYEEISEEEE